MSGGNRIFDIMPKNQDDASKPTQSPDMSDDEELNENPPPAPLELGVENKEDHDLESIDQAEESEEVVLLEWDALDREELKNRLLYFLGAGIIVLCLLAYIIYKKDYVGAVFLLVIFVAFVFYKLQKPKEIHYAFSNYGLFVNDKYYHYQEFHSFWFIDTKNQSHIHFLFNKKYLPKLIINLQEQENETVRNVIQNYLPEQEDVAEPIMDKIIRILKL
ncbi:MAG: hypothetical protein WCI63_00420 [bacterium]